MCLFSSQVLVPTNISVPLNSATISVEYNQMLHLYFGEYVRGLHIFRKNYEDDVLLFWKIIIGQTEYSSLSGKTHICDI